MLGTRLHRVLDAEAEAAVEEEVVVAGVEAEVAALVEDIEVAAVEYRRWWLRY